jgi:hypothetical protein
MFRGRADPTRNKKAQSAEMRSLAQNLFALVRQLAPLSRIQHDWLHKQAEYHLATDGNV